MKYIFLFLLLTAIAWQGHAQGIQFESDLSWEEVKKKAKELNKPIFVDVHTSWCEPCKWMDKEIFPQKDAGVFFNEHFVNYQVNIERGDGVDFAREHRIAAFPTLLYFNAEGEMSHKVIGSFDVNELIDVANAALDTNRQFFRLQERYENGDRTPDLLYLYAHALRMAMGNYKPVAAAYLETQAKEELLNKKNFEFIETFMDNYNNEFYSCVVDNQTELKEKYGPMRIQNYLDKPFYNEIFKVLDYGEGKRGMRNVLKDVERLRPERKEYFETYIKYINKKHNPNKGYKFAKELAEERCKNPLELQKIVTYIIETQVDHPNRLEEAIQWIDRAISLDDSILNRKTKVDLLIVLGRKKKAYQLAKEVLALAQKRNEPTDKIEALVEELK